MTQAVLERTGSPKQQGETRAGVSFATALIAILAMLALWVGGQWPVVMDFKHFVFYDAGSMLKADRLLTEGMRPSVDFAFSYGLLPLAVGRAWFAVFGRTPLAYEFLVLVLQIGMACGMARLAHTWRWNYLALGLFLVLMMYAMQDRYVTQVHPFEAMLLIHALADHAQGRRDRALTLTTVCAFVKPSMAYIYGAILVVLLTAECIRMARGAGGWSAALRQLGKAIFPSVVVATGLAAILGGHYGFDALQRTELPLNAHRSYAAANFGFFLGVGRDFWLRADPLDYLVTEAGTWLAVAAITTAAGVVLAGKRIRGAWSAPGARATAEGAAGDEALLCAIVLHTVFVCWLYAWKGSWSYYAYLPMLGVATVIARWRKAAMPAAGLLIMLAVAGQIGRLENLHWKWRKVHDETTNWLWADEDIYNDWTEAKRDTVGSGFYFLCNGDASGLFGSVRGPRSWFLSPKLNTPEEIARIHQDLERAKYVVRYRELEEQKLDPWWWEEFADVRARFREFRRNGSLIIMQRIEPREGAE